MRVLTLNGKPYGLETASHPPLLSLADCELGKSNLLRLIRTPFMLKIGDPEQMARVRVFLQAAVLPKASTLVIPRVIDSGTIAGSGWLLLNYHEEARLVVNWSEHDPNTAGGKSIPIAMADWFVHALTAFAKIGVAGIPSSFYRPGVDRLQDCRRLLDQAVLSELIPTNDAELAFQLASSTFVEVRNRFFVNNGDFQFRNFLRIGDGRTLVIDWEHCSVSPFELEYMLAYQTILMWNNPAWIRRALREGIDGLGLSAGALRSCVLMASIRQALFWSRFHELSSRQISLFQSALHTQDIRHLI